MCGIAGIIASSERAVREALTPMLSAIVHRGPDDQGIEVLPFGDAFIGLGHRRLSIIDLSPAGHQPMVHRPTGDRIVFNGEVYNFERLRPEVSDEPFAGHSDTEVMLRMLAKSGPKATARFEGMFAFAYLDNRQRRLTLARDAMGIKPLYLAKVPGAILFASEVRSLLASGLVDRRLSRAGLATLLAYGAVQQPLTFFQGIESFPPGSTVDLTPESLSKPLPRPSTFWVPPRPDKSVTEASALQEMPALFSSAVKEHLVADVPVGVFLSSGLDSTIVAGLAARHTDQLRSFTVGFTDQPDLSEADQATETARLFGLKHTNIDITGSEAQGAVENWLSSLDQPSLDGLNIYLISRAVRREGIIVALSGQGGDELFGGYPSFKDVPDLRRLIRRIRFLPSSVRSALARFAGLATGKSVAVREKLADFFATNGNILDLALLRRRTMSNSQLTALGLTPESAGVDPTFVPKSIRAELPEIVDDVIWTICATEASQYQGNTLLRDSDTNGMAHSLEIRVPLLDQRIVNFAYSVPGSVRLPAGAPGKMLLRKAFGNLLRDDLLARQKRGFSLPIARWMVGPLRHHCENAIDVVKKQSGLEPRGIDAIWNGFLADPASPIWSRAWTLVVLGNYISRVNAVA